MNTTSTNLTSSKSNAERNFSVLFTARYHQYSGPFSTIIRTEAHKLETQTFAKAFIMQCYATWVSEPFWNHFRKSPAKIPTFSWRKCNFPNKQLAQFLLGVNLPLSLCSIEILWLQVLKDKCWYSKPKLLTQSSYRTKI